MPRCRKLALQISYFLHEVLLDDDSCLLEKFLDEAIDDQIVF
jgi:hypothetical protein